MSAWRRCGVTLLVASIGTIGCGQRLEPRSDDRDLVSLWDLPVPPVDIRLRLGHDVRFRVGFGKSLPEMVLKVVPTSEKVAKAAQRNAVPSSQRPARALEIEALCEGDDEAVEQGITRLLREGVATRRTLRLLERQVLLPRRGMARLLNHTAATTLGLARAIPRDLAASMIDALEDEREHGMAIAFAWALSADPRLDADVAAALRPDTPAAIWLALSIWLGGRSSPMAVERLTAIVGANDRDAAVIAAETLVALGAWDEARGRSALVGRED